MPRTPKLDQLRNLIRELLHRLKLAITRPRDELDRWEAAARYAHDLGTFGARQLRRDRAPQMAGALAFRTLFGLLPVLVMAAVVVRALRGPDAFIELVNQIITAAGLYGVGASAGNPLGLGGMIRDLVEQAARYDASAIGWIGMAVLVYAAVSLMVTIENSFNVVYRAPEGRSWIKRFPMYWFVLTIGPVVIAVSVFLNQRVETWIVSFEGMRWLIKSAAGLWTFTIMWMFMYAVYELVPNTAIRMRPALAGSFVAAVLLFIGKRVLGAYLANAVSITQFGGSLGLIPLFMFWVYVMWLIVLFGLQVSATLQMLGGRRLEEMEPRRLPSGLFDPTSVLSVMELVATRFREATPASTREITDAIGLDEPTVKLMLNELVERGFLHHVDQPGGETAVTLARPPELIPADRLIDVGFAMIDEAGGERRAPILERLREAQRQLAAQATLVELLPPQSVAGGADQARAV